MSYEKQYIIEFVEKNMNRTVIYSTKKADGTDSTDTGVVVGYMTDSGQPGVSVTLAPYLVKTGKHAYTWQVPFHKILCVDEEAAVKARKYPHICPKCKSPAFMGFLQIDCSNWSCK